MSESDINPCPFGCVAGGNGEVYLTKASTETVCGIDLDGYEVQCGICGLTGPIKITKDEAVNSWNYITVNADTTGGSVVSSIDKNVDAVCDKFQGRATLGKEKYGVTTERTDLSILEWLDHLQDELMDAAVYIQKLKSNEQTQLEQANELRAKGDDDDALS